MTPQELDDLIKLPIHDKIKRSRKIIREFFSETGGKVYIAFSGGKDSTVLLNLVRAEFPDVKAVFSNTTNEYSEILKFVKKVENTVTIHPKMTFKETIDKFGFPLVSKKVSRQIQDLRNPTDRNLATRKLYLTGVKRDGSISKSFKLPKKWYKLIDAKFDITNKCCDVLKKEPFRRYEKETGLKPFIGTMATDSTTRRQSLIQTGEISYSAHMSARPLGIWTEENIWEYIRINDIDYCEIYDDKKLRNGDIVRGEKRTGCKYCAFGAHLEKSNLEDKNRFERIKQRSPKQYEKIMGLKNNGVEMREALTFIGVRT